MLPPLASLTDFTDRLGRPLSGVDATRAESAIRDASAIVRTEAGENWVDVNGDLTEVPEAIVAITMAVARRSWENPSGKTTTSEGIGQYTEANGWANASADVYLKASEKAIIRAVTGRSGGVGTLSTTRGHLETPSVLSGSDGFVGPPIIWGDGGILS